jgi:hypothetical protein
MIMHINEKHYYNDDKFAWLITFKRRAHSTSMGGGVSQSLGVNTGSDQKVPKCVAG